MHEMDCKERLHLSLKKIVTPFGELDLREQIRQNCEKEGHLLEHRNCQPFLVEGELQVHL